MPQAVLNHLRSAVRAIAVAPERGDTADAVARAASHSIQQLVMAIEELNLEVDKLMKEKQSK